MLQKRCRESNNRRIRAWALIAIAGIVALVCFPGLVMAVEIPVLEQKAVDPAQQDVLAAKLGNIWSLEDILRVAVANNPSMQIADWELREALAGRQEVDAALRPQLSLTGQHKVENLANNPAVLQGFMSQFEAQYGEEYALYPLVVGGLTLDDRLSTTIGSLTYYQQLGPNAQLKGLTKQAEIGTEIAVLRREQAIKDIVITAQSGYYDVLRAYNGLELAREAWRHAELNLKTAEEQLTLGMATPLDVLKERNTCIEAENGLQAAAMGLELATLALLQHMGLGNVEVDTALAWAEYLAESQDMSVIPWTVELDTAYAYTLEHRPELAMARQQRAMTETAYTSVKEERDWTVKLAGQYMPEDDLILQSSIDSNRALMGTVVKTKVNKPEVDQSKMRYLSESETSEIPAFDSVDPWQIELSLTYRFGDGGARKAKLAAKEAAVEKARVQEKMAQDGVYLDLNSRLQQLDLAWKAYELALEGERAAQETLEQLRLLYDLGSVTGKEVREGRLMVLQAQNRVLDAGFTYETNKSKVVLAMGIDTETLVRVVGRNEWDGLMEN